ncbi:hypothetical protein N6H14_17430 [Paenibacillus sp. CC-CFT747]|nr:hypothetical protein N6H14_17430 [Paenibacillus sp. CC-CFT747]
MFKLKADGFSWDRDLQIIHADVVLEVDGETIVDEPLCVDVGLPALLLSALEDTKPNRWADPGEWSRMPFLVCGCGDPECRAYSFRVEHEGAGRIRLMELEESPDGTSRELAFYEVDQAEYREAVRRLAEDYLAFTEGLAYKPLVKDTPAIVRELLERLSLAEAGYTAGE